MTDTAVFLDRDGTLIEDRGYICQFSEVKIFSFAVPAIKRLSQSRYRVIVVTNQSSIARGICSEDQVQKLHGQITSYFNRRGARIDRFYYSPYHENGKIEKFRKKHRNRKPGPGMILDAAKDFDINLKNSYMIGDSSGDILAGKQAGCRTILVLTGNGEKAKQELNREGKAPDFIVPNLMEAVDVVLGTGPVI